MTRQRSTEQRLDDLEEAVERLGRLLSDSLRRAKTPATPSIWAWQHLTAKRAVDQWEELRQWLTWAVDRYPRALRDLPDCWHLHTDAVEELTALWASWKAAYHGSDEPTDRPITWHDRWLPGTVQRLLGATGILAPCARNKAHTPVTPSPRDTFVAGAEPTFEEHVAADADRRANPPIRL